MLDIRKNSIYDEYCISRYLYQCYSKIFFGVVWIAQLVEVKDSAVLAVLSRSWVRFPRWVIKNISAFSGIVDLLYLSI